MICKATALTYRLVQLSHESGHPTICFIYHSHLDFLS